MRKCILFILGNRDLQFSEKTPDKYDRWLQTNNEDEHFKVIKTDKKGTSFFDYSKEIFESLNEVKEFISFAMIDDSLGELTGPKPDIVFSTSDQNPSDRQDCKFIALIGAQLYKERGYNTIVKNFSCPPVDVAQMTDFFINLTDDLRNNYDDVTVSTSGGTPDMRTATFAAGFFKGFKYITINARTKKACYNSFSVLEQKVLHNIIENMLRLYDFEGIRLLPVTGEIKEIATEAVEAYNLDVKKLPGKTAYKEHAANALILLVDNMRVCYFQGRYAEALGRLFRIEEAIWYMMYYDFLSENGFVAAADPNKICYQIAGLNKKKDIDRILNFGLHYNLELLLSSKYRYLIKWDDADDVLANYKKARLITGVAYNAELELSGKNWFYFFFCRLGIYTDVCSFFGRLNKDEQNNAYTSKSILNKLRNKSYLGHGFEGIKKQDVDDLLGVNYSAFDNILRALVTKYTGKQVPQVFEDFSNKIRQLL